MTQVVTQISAADVGRRMSLGEFEFAEVTDGSGYELGRGVVTMVDVPGFAHAAQIDTLRQQIGDYRRAHPDKIKAALGSLECKVLLRSLESERHPDLAVYRSLPEEPNNWAAYIPDIVVEVISPSSRQRDYEEKPEEYLQFGVREYWIIDRPENLMLVHRRLGGRWSTSEVRPPQPYECPTLRGLTIDVAGVFDAAREFE